MSCCGGHRHGPACPWGAALLQMWGTQKGHFSSLIWQGVRELGWSRPDLQAVIKPAKMPDAQDAACPLAASGFCRAGGALALGVGRDDPWRLGPQGVGRGRVAPCTVSSVPPSSAQPVEVSSAGMAVASHHLLQRPPLHRSVLAEVTSPHPVSCTTLEGGMKSR